MNSVTKQLYMAIGALCLMAMLAPLVVTFVAAVLPLVVVGGLVVIVVRLVWLYTNR